MDLSGKVALITGTRRIGRAIGLALAERGADVGLIYRSSRDEARSAAERIRSLGRNAIAVEADLVEPDQVKVAVATAGRELGGIDILLNVASIYREVPFHDVGAGDWDENLDANARSALLCSQEVIPVMRARGGGHIINFADWLPASHRPRYPGYTSYYTSKAAVLALTEAMALEVAGDGILVNAIAPGPIVPHEGITDRENSEVLRNTPLGRWGGETAIVQAVMALLMCDFVTGEMLRVDGGRHLR